MRIVFMGTPDFSVGALEALGEAGHDIAAVITQPDKAKGRGKAVQFTPVKEAALKHDLRVYQPQKVREPEFVELLREINPEVMVVVAFGQILTKEILDIPMYGCLNIHASLLPKYRGASPIQQAVIDGEEKSGVTIMQMDEGIDTGDIIKKREVVLDKKETGGSLFDKLSVVGAELIVEVLKDIENGNITHIKQDDSRATHVGMIKKSSGLIDFSKPAVEIERLIRGMNPWPSAYTKLSDKTLKIWDADVCEMESEAEPGEVIKVDKNGIYVKTGKDVLVINELQLEGKKRMETSAFLLGYHVEEKTMLG